MLIPLSKIRKDYNLNIRGVLHIGSHYGEEYWDYVKEGVQKMIFFEPISDNFKRLEEAHDNRNDVRLIQLALGSVAGKAEMYVETANKGQSCSLLEPGTHRTLYPHIQFTGKEMVNVERLDNISFYREDYNMINIDVQGFELEVFKGAMETLEYIDYIYAEVNFEEVYKGCALVWDIDAFLEDFGFERVHTFCPQRTPTEQYPWGDALYIKQ